MKKWQKIYKITNLFSKIILKIFHCKKIWPKYYFEAPPKKMKKFEKKKL
jgi:hypothetical protein